VDAMATAAVRHGLRSRPQRKAVKAGVKTDDPVRGKTKTGHQLQVAMALGASLANLQTARGRRRVQGALDRVFPVAVAASGRFAVAGGDRPAMNALLKLFRFFGVAHAACLDRFATERGRSRTGDFMSAAMADAAIRRHFVPCKSLLPVHAKGGLIGLRRMTDAAFHRHRFGRVGKLGAAGMAA